MKPLFAINRFLQHFTPSELPRLWTFTRPMLEGPGLVKETAHMDSLIQKGSYESALDYLRSQQALPIREVWAGDIDHFIRVTDPKGMVEHLSKIVGNQEEIRGILLHPEPPKSPPKRFMLDPSHGIGCDLVTFNFDRPSLVGKIDALTPKDEKKFEEGAQIHRAPKHPPTNPPTYEYLFEQVQPNRSDIAKTFFEKWTAYKKWSEAEGFIKVPISIAELALKELTSRMEAMGIEISFGRRTRGFLRGDQLHQVLERWGAQFIYLNELLKLLPESMLKSDTLKEIRLNSDASHPVLRDTGSHYENGIVRIFPAVLRGSRHRMAAMTLHEIGHSIFYRFQLVDGDPLIPEETRQKMLAMHSLLRGGPNELNGFLGLDWGGGRDKRKNYQRRYKEFLAELNLAYVAAGPALRVHIESFDKGSPEREAWDFIYTEIRIRIYEGREYDYKGLS